VEAEVEEWEVEWEEVEGRRERERGEDSRRRCG